MIFLDRVQETTAIWRNIREGRNLFWREHLDRNFPEPDRGRLYALLETAARDENGVTGDTLLAALN